MEEKQLSYVTRLSAASLAKLVSELPKDNQPQLWDRTRVMEVAHEGTRYVIAGGESRQFRDSQRRETRIKKAEAALEHLASRKRKKPNAQKLASTAGRLLERLSAHKYFAYQVNEAGKLLWSRKETLIEDEKTIDGLYLLRTNLVSEKASGPQVLGHYKNLIAVEDAFCQLKSYLEVRPVFHYRPDRVRNHVRICFLAYWLTARLGQAWRALGETREVPRLLRQLQSIRVGFLSVKGKPSKALLTEVPKEINDVLKNLNLVNLFASPPQWTTL
jgi:transposase